MAERLGRWLRRLADRIDHENAPRAAGWRFHIVEGTGLVWTEEGRSHLPSIGCRVWYFPKDYVHAFVSTGQVSD